MSGFFGKMLGSLEGAEGQGPNAAGLVSDLVNQHGGLSGLMDQINQGGLGDKLQSWMGQGGNLPMLASEVERVFPPDQLAALAEKHGVPASVVSEVLARALPHAVDQATPAQPAGAEATDDGSET